jgi:hypothetical protein
MTAAARLREILRLEREAAASLESQGYVVFCFNDHDNPGHLFASRDDQGIFITLARANRPPATTGDVEKSHAGIIGMFRSFPPPKDFTFEIWVCSSSPKTWQYYRVGPDQVTEVDHA